MRDGLKRVADGIAQEGRDKPRVLQRLRRRLVTKGFGDAVSPGLADCLDFYVRSGERLEDLGDIAGISWPELRPYLASTFATLGWAVDEYGRIGRAA